MLEGCTPGVSPCSLSHPLLDSLLLCVLLLGWMGRVSQPLKDVRVMNTSPLLPPGAVARQRWFFAGLLLFFVALSLQYTFKVTNTHHDTHRDTRSAFLRWREQLLELEE